MQTTCSRISKWKCYKNLVTLSVGWILLYSSFTSIKDLSSSFHHQDGIGLIGMATFYFGYMMACIFAGRTVRLFDAKVSISCTSLCQIPFLISNASPKFYVLLPLSFLGGFTQSILWTASGSYLVWISQTMSTNQRNNVNKVFSIFSLVVSCSPILGGMSTVLAFSLYGKDRQHFQKQIKQINTTFENDISKTLIFKSKSSDNLTDTEVCGPGVCFFENNIPNLALPRAKLYIILGFYTGCMLAASAMFLFVMDRYIPEKDEPIKYKICISVTNITKILYSTTFVKVFPLLFHYGFQMAFMSGSFFKEYVGCRYGIEKIGYFLSVFGFSSAFSSGLSGFIHTGTGREYVFMFACLAEVVAVAGMLMWNYFSSYMTYTIGLCSLWGLAHGIWQTHLNGYIGESFPLTSEFAFSSLNLILSLGLITGYSSSNYICMRTKLYVTGGMCIISSCFFLIMSKIARQKCAINKNFKRVSKMKELDIFVFSNVSSRLE
ncbi:protein unc-93 homolog A-like [Mytilus californianus]|uniref:protein unc-93 homolog A-like n=1 Tax=Mytilus californianus TaxID=6549 RepID=UPI00224719D9|nr:protein unc-93 homolog A-like [Mytilus californianus]